MKVRTGHNRVNVYSEKVRTVNVYSEKVIAGYKRVNVYSEGEKKLVRQERWHLIRKKRDEDEDEEATSTSSCKPCETLHR